MTNKIIAFLFLLTISLPINAQQKQLSQITNEDEVLAIEAIALYSKTERSNILEASKYPEILARMQSMQSKTEASFQNLLFPLTRADQEKFYDLSRHPELIKQMTAGGVQLSDKALNETLKNYPSEVHKSAKELNNKQFSTLSAVGGLFGKYDNDFNSMLSDYPLATQEAYNELIKQPEIVEILTDNMNMTVLLGDIYRRQPADLVQELDALNASVSARKAQELEEWQKSLEENPEALAEYEQAAKDYAAAEGYDESEYNTPVQQHFTTEVYIQHSWQPYPYWFGRPWWYAHNYWYSYPWWYHWGFYYGPGYGIVFVGLPSYGFVNWHFYNPYCFYYYPHYTNAVITHCHRASTGSSMQNVVRQWENGVKGELPDNWLAADEKRPERIRELGKFELDYTDAVENKADNIPSKAEYLNQNRDNYPTIEPVLTEKPEALGSIKAPVSNQSQPSRTIPPAVKPHSVDPQKSEARPIDRATDYHQNTWSKPKAPTRAPAQQRAPSSPSTPKAPSQKAPSNTSRPNSAPSRAPVQSQPRRPSTPASSPKSTNPTKR